MATYTSQWFSVDNGDTTTHDPQSLVSETSPIQVLNAQIQWEGIQTSDTSTSTDYSTNTNTTSATATTDSTTVTDSDSATATTTSGSVENNKQGTSDGNVNFVDFPSPPSGSTADQWLLTLTADTSIADNPTNYSYTDINNDQQSKSVAAGTDGFIYTDTTTTDQTGTTRSFSVEDKSTLVTGYMTARTYYETVESKTASATAQSLPSGYDFGYINVKKYENGSVVSSNNYSDSSYVGDTFSITSTDPDVTVEVVVDTNGSTTNSDTSCTSYPSVPNGYSFDRHYWREEKNGSYVDSSYIYTNKVGDSRCVTSDDPSNTWDLTLRTRGSDTTTTTTYYDTKDPSVSGDVSCSYNGVLNDGETSPWQTLSGLITGENTFNHSISQSNKANFRFEFEWEQIAPDPVYGTVAFYDDSMNVMRECSVADPTNSKLEYNHVTVYNESQDSWGALDVVDVSDPNAIESHQFYDSTVGWLAPREYNTQSL
jgi:hypothetical protein